MRIENVLNQNIDFDSSKFTATFTISLKINFI